MKIQFGLIIACVSTTLAQGCDSSGIGCSHSYSFIPSSTINDRPLSRGTATVNAIQPAVVDTWSYLAPGNTFSLAIDIKNTSNISLQISDLLTSTESGRVVPSQFKIQWANRCKPPACHETEFFQKAEKMELAPKENGRFNLAIEKSDVIGLNQLDHELIMVSANEQSVFSVTWSMIRIEQRINCIQGKGHGYRLAE